MRKIYSFILCITLLICMQTQAQDRISYQAVVRVGAQNTLVSNAQVGVKISILQGSESGSAIYEETHTVTTNANGLLTLPIGGGTAVNGTFAAIDWADAPYFVKTEIDPAGGTSYLLSSTTQLLTVPYALHAKTAATISGTIPAEKITGLSANFTGDYDDLTNKPTLFSGVYEDLSGKPALFSGKYSDLTGIPTLATVATSGSYNDLQDKPVIGENGFSGSYADLNGKPSIKDSIAAYGFNGNYNSLDNKPPLFSGAYTDLAGIPAFATVATSGSYNDLRDKPVIGGNGFSGIYADLSGKPSIKDSIATYGFNGNYNSLTNKPLLFSGSYDDLTDVPVIQGFSGDYNDLTNKPNIKDSIATYGFDGDYDKLTNKPVNVSSFTNDANYATRSEIATIPDGADVGDMLFWESGTKGWNRVPVGTEGQILSIKNGVPTWIDFDASANTYKIGDVYLEDGVAKGIIADISADGSEGLVVSPDEYAGLKWGPNTTLINTGTDGYANTNLIRAAADYNGGAAYLAAFTCVNLGADEWFLPSKEELLKVYANRSFINQRLEAYGKTKLGATASAYWTSSEKDAGNAYLLQFATESTHFAGTVYEVKKDSAIAVRAIRKLTSAEIKSRPDGYKFYKVGDVYYDGRTPVGVVYEISDGGLHGKMVAVEHDLKAWSIAATQIITNAVSNSNGQANLDSIMANVVFDKTFFPDPPDYMIFSACKGEGWYAPAKDEMLAIYNVRASIDVTLNQLKAQGEYIDLLDVSNQDTKIYWTSTEKDLNNAYGISFEDGSVVEKLKNTTGYIRGVRKF